MKKLALLLGLSLVATANAAFVPTQKSTETYSYIATDKPLPLGLLKGKKARKFDDKIVTVQGYIIHQVDDDKYIIRDLTGRAKIEISPKFFQLDVSEKDLIQVKAKVDADDGDLELEAVEPIQPVLLK